MNRNLYHSGNLIARNQISLKARILHQKVSIFQFVFARRIASSPVHSISLVKGTQASIPSCCFFVFFENIHKKGSESIFHQYHLMYIRSPFLIRDDEKGICRLMEGNNADRSWFPVYQISFWKWKQKGIDSRIRPETTRIWDCLIV